MNKAAKRLLSRKQRQQRVRKKNFGTAERPRLAVFRSLKNIYVQAIDDSNGQTIASASTVDKDIRSRLEGFSGNANAAKMVGKVVAERLMSKSVSSVVFDRGGFLYHGRVRALAEAAREAGIKF